MAQLHLPVLRLSDPEDELGAQFKAASESLGFMQLVGHGIAPSVISRAFAMARMFFELPIEKKLALKRDPKSNRGYEVIASQSLEGSLGSHDTHEGAHLVNREVAAQKLGDQKEGLMMGIDLQPGDKNYERYAHGSNILPDEETIPGFKEVYAEYLEKLWELQKKMSKIVAISLGLDPDTSFPAEVCENAIVYVRYLHYPPTTEKDVIGTGSHTDFGFTTILATSGTPGLELYSEGAWHAVEPEEGAFILNVGDCLSRMTNGKYKSSLHRVVNKSGQHRYSIPCFLEGNPDFVVRPLGADPLAPCETVEDVLRGRFDTTYKPGYR